MRGEEHSMSFYKLHTTDSTYLCYSSRKAIKMVILSEKWWQHPFSSKSFPLDLQGVTIRAVQPLYFSTMVDGFSLNLKIKTIYRENFRMKENILLPTQL
jgi:hypothetical protein